MIEFYRAFWNTVGNLLVDISNFAHKYSDPPKEAIVTLIEKKDRDEIYLSNWRLHDLAN